MFSSAITNDDGQRPPAPSAAAPPATWWRRALAWRWTPACAIALAVALLLPSLTVGIVVDDWLQQVVMRGPHLPGVTRNPLDLFAFAGHNGDGNRAAIESGMFPWWADPACKLAFWRPLTSLTHWLDWRLWPDRGLPMHAHNLAWFALALLAAAAFYRRFGGGLVAGSLGLVLYALDPTHAPAVGWISNRNAMVALALALPVLLLHDRARRDGWRPGAWLAPLLFAVSLGAGEAAVSVLAYLVAHALWLDRGPLLARLGRLWPYLLVLVVWRAAYVHLGYGTASSDVYLDAAHQPLAYLRAIPSRLIYLVAGEVGLPWSDFAEIWPYVGPRAPWVALALATLSTVGFVAWLWPVVQCERRARFYATGGALALLPIASTFPADRLLWWVGLGALGLVAERLVTLPRRAWPLAGALLAVTMHLVLAPLLLAYRSRSMDPVARPIARIDESLPMSADMAERTVVLVNPPGDLLAGYLSIRRAALREPRPRFRWLTSGTSAVTVHRDDARTLTVTPDDGYLAHVSERMLRSLRSPLPPGTRVVLSDLTIEVLSAMPDGRPRAVRFRFARALDDPRYYWAQWGVLGYVPFTPPPVGATVTLPASDFLKPLLTPAP